MPNILRRHVDDDIISHYDGELLATSQWMNQHEISQQFLIRTNVPSNKFWLGEALEQNRTPIGYADDRHISLIASARSGKGSGIIIPNLCLWPGSCVVIDPKGENATVTARRRGNGSKYAIGLKQKVCILDPFGEIDLPPELKTRFNPLDAIDPHGDLAVDDAGRIAAALIIRESKGDPFFDDAARNLLRGLILHVISDDSFKDCRNLITVRRLLTQGNWIAITKAIENGDDKPPSAFNLLWLHMRRNQAFNGIVAGVGEQMLSMAERTRSSILETARSNTVFLDGIPMQRILDASDFDLAELKTNPRGITIYLTLPQRYMETHNRWLRLMVSLAIGEMERIKGKPKSGYPTLFILDEFAGLKRMETVEHAVAQAAGFGVKFLFVVQNLAQLKREYDEGWENFVSNSGLKIYLQNEDLFTREYLSKQLGECEVTRKTSTNSQANTIGRSRSTGTSYSKSEGESYERGFLFGWNKSGLNEGSSTTTNTTETDSSGNTLTTGTNESIHKRPLLNTDEIGRLLSRIDDTNHPSYPGLLVSLIPGQHPILAQRINYFESVWFEGFFDPHPDHPPPPTLEERVEISRNRKELVLSGNRHNSKKKMRFKLAFITTAAILALTISLFASKILNRKEQHGDVQISWQQRDKEAVEQLISQVVGPGFNCENVKLTKLEELLCTVPELARHDEVMTRIYRSLSTHLDKSSFAKIKKENREWIKKRNNDCQSKGKDDAAIQCLTEYINNYRNILLNTHHRMIGPFLVEKQP